MCDKRLGNELLKWKTNYLIAIDFSNGCDRSKKLYRQVHFRLKELNLGK